jgi:hypothetical protein
MIQKLNWSHDNILAYEASGILTKEENVQVYDEIRALIQKCGKVRLFIRLPKLVLPELRAIGVRIKFAREHLRDIERYAVVTNSELVKKLSSLARFMPRIQLRSFPLYQEKIAREWLESDNIKYKHNILIISSLAALIMVALLIALFRFCEIFPGNKWFKINH